mgnify:CR=1 FL=1|jgi:hypothetical protein
MKSLDEDFNGKKMTLSEPPAEDEDELFELLDEEKPKIKRNFTEFENNQKPKEEVKGALKNERLLQNQESKVADDSDNRMVNENWPKFLGSTAIKAHIIFSSQHNLKEGDPLQLRREKQMLNTSQAGKKKGFQKKAPITANPTVVRVLYKDEEVMLDLLY